VTTQLYYYYYYYYYHHHHHHLRVWHPVVLSRKEREIRNRLRLHVLYIGKQIPLFYNKSLNVLDFFTKYINQPNNYRNILK
jgi:hypothetical protein